MKANKMKLVLLLLCGFTLLTTSQAPRAQDEDIRIEDTLPERGKTADEKFYRKLEQSDIDYFVNGSKELVSEHRDANRGSMDLVAIRPYLERSLHDYKDFSYFTAAEYLTFKKRYDTLLDAAKKQKMNDDQKSKALLDLVKQTVEEVAKNPLEKKAPNVLCHSSYECAKGLDCVTVPARATDKLASILKASKIDSNKCLPSGSVTSDFSQCCSGETKDSYGKTVCAEVKACSTSVAKGSSCFDNENCTKGLECVQAQSFNCGVQSFADIIGIALPKGLSDQGSSCKSNEDCASNSCISGTCQESFTCLPACVGSQNTPDRGKKCCPGLIEENVNGKVMCVPNCPPMGAFIEKKSKRSTLDMIISFISPISTAHAQGQDSTGFLQNTAIGDNTPTPITDPGPDSSHIDQNFRNEIKSQKEKFSPGNIHRQVQESEAKILKDALTLSAEQRKNNTIANVPAFALRAGSDFNSCVIDFRADHYIYLQNKEDQEKKIAKGKLFDIEMALLGFEFVALGQGTQDYWKAGEENKTMHNRLKEVAEKRREFRHAYLEDLKLVNKEVRCLCLDKNGYEKISNDEQEWFREHCPDEYTAHTEIKQQLAQNEVQTDDYDGDASGIKYKRMLVAWTAANKKFADILYSGNNVHLANLNSLANWARTNNWYEVETKQYDVFNFTVKNPGAVASGILVGAMLAAAVVAVVSGMAMGPTISLWATIGIITSSGVAGGAGMWLVGALKGAWVAQGPEVYDDHVKGPYKCGKKDQCSDYKRILYQPYNNVCKTHTGANACVRSFVVYKKDQKDQILVDPFIPLNVNKDDIIKDKRSYATLMDQGFQNALSEMRGKRPRGQENTSYFDKTFIDSAVIGHYTPPIDKEYNNYVLGQAQMNAIKKAARDYAIAEDFFPDTSFDGLYQEGSEDNLDKFANYVFKFHFVWPRVSLPDRIAYPLPGFQTYLEMVSSMLDVVTIDNGANIAGYTDLHQNYVNDYLHTIKNIGTASRLSQKDIQGIEGDPLDSINEDVEQINSSFQRTAGLFTGSSNPSMSSSGNVIDAGASAAAGASGLLSESGLVQNAIAANAKAREDKKKRLQEFKKNNKGNKKAEALAAFQDQMMAAMTSPVGGATGAASGLASSAFGSGLLGSGSGGQKAMADKEKSGEESSSGIDWGDAFKGNAPGSSGGSYGGVDYGAQYNGNSVSGSGDSDNRRLFEAVEARDSSSKNYQGSEGDSLFDKITKAYIRNYDRVLRKIPTE